MADNLPPLSQSLDRIQAWALDHALDVTFRPPAKESAIVNFIDKSGLMLPDDLRKTLLIVDGESRKSAGMIGNWRLMPVSEIQASWGLLTRLSEKGAFAASDPKTPPYIRKSWWHPSWVPVVSSDTGYYFCVDTDPPEPDRHGQVLLFLQDRPERPLVAASLSAWFDRIAQDLEAGLYDYDPEDGFEVEAFMWSSLEGKHLFDGVGGPLVAFGYDI